MLQTKAASRTIFTDLLNSMETAGLNFAKSQWPHIMLLSFVSLSHVAPAKMSEMYYMILHCMFIWDLFHTSMKCCRWTQHEAPPSSQPLSSQYPALSPQLLNDDDNGLMCYSLHKALIFNNSPQCPIARNWKIKQFQVLWR